MEFLTLLMAGLCMDKTCLLHSTLLTLDMMYMCLTIEETNTLEIISKFTQTIKNFGSSHLLILLKTIKLILNTLERTQGLKK